MALGQLLDVDPDLLDLEDARSGLHALVAHERRVTAARLRFLSSLDRRNAWKADGAGSMADWAAKATGSTRKQARKDTGTAAKLTDMPNIGEPPRTRPNPATRPNRGNSPSAT